MIADWAIIEFDSAALIISSCPKFSLVGGLYVILCVHRNGTGFLLFILVSASFIICYSFEYFKLNKNFILS